MELTTVQEIERAINALTPQQRDELCQRFDEHYLQPIDVQFKADLEAGRLDDRVDA